MGKRALKKRECARPGQGARQGETSSTQNVSNPLFVWAQCEQPFQNENTDKAFLAKRLPNVTEPIHYFLLLFTEELVREIVEQTNLYATQNNATSFSPISVEEFYGFIGIMIAMGLCKLPRMRDYWQKGIFGMAWFRSIMSRTRFFQIQKYLHVNAHLEGSQATNYIKFSRSSMFWLALFRGITPLGSP